ncbi:MAG: hypothetical protein NC131_18590 [Roseburia sp.]|nr:hypothetical protein [Roseburia sp.]
MNCPKCESGMHFDEESRTYYCEACNHLYSEDEIVEPVSELYKLTPLMSIPFLNVIFLRYAKNADEKKVYSNIIISSMAITLVYMFIFVCILYFVKGTTLDTFRVEARQYLETTVAEYDPRNLTPVIPEFKYVPIGEKPAEEERVYELDDETVRLLANSAVTGETLKHIVNQYPAYSYLVQTLSCVQKYQDMSYYFCVGHAIREANNTNSGTSNVNFYVGDLEGSFTQLAQVFDSSVLEEERTIMYIYESQKFNITPIYNRSGNIIGLAFVELEV